MLETSGTKYKTEGETILEAMQAIPLAWNKLKAKGEITVMKGKLKYTHLFYLKPLRRILINKTTKIMWAKRLEILLEATK